MSRGRATSCIVVLVVFDGVLFLCQLQQEIWDSLLTAREGGVLFVFAEELL